MTATDELCRMLDERRVEYVLDEEYGKKYPPEKRVTWSCDLAGEDMTVTARDYCINISDDGSADYCLDLEFHEVFTPEQAIEATLGDIDATRERQGVASSNCTNSGRMSEELKPCPFCGRPAKVESWWSDTEECGIAVARCTKESYVNGYDCASIYVYRVDAKAAREDAISAWNRRANHVLDD